jgi:FkbM family methyltransferase
MNISQYVYNALIDNTSQNFFNLIKFKILYRIRKFLIKICKDPIISYHIGKFKIKMPLSHELGIYQIGTEFLTNQGRIASHLNNKYKDLSIIIVGANVGDSIATIKNYVDVSILAIDGEKSIFSLLSENTEQFKNTTLINIFLDEKEQDIQGELAIQEGTATFSKGFDETQKTKTTTLEKTLKENINFWHSKAIFIDTDGFDFKIIRGAKNWLSEIQPLVYFEYDPFHLNNQNENGLLIFETLFQLGYKNLLIYFNTGEYFCSSNLTNSIFLQDIHEYASHQNGNFYYDICAFSEKDNNLFELIRISEINFFNNIKQKRYINNNKLFKN